MPTEEIIRISHDNIIETALWREIFGANLRDQWSRLSRAQFDGALVEAAAIADRAVELLRQRTHQAPAGPSDRGFTP